MMGKNQKGFAHIPILLGGVIVLAVAGYFAYQAVAARNNKQAFVQSRAAIDTVYADIVTKVGKPDNFKRTNDCSRPSQEFTQGPLSCSVGTDFIYGVDNEQLANTLFKQIQGVINSHSDLFKPTKPLSTSITDTLVASTYYHKSLDYYMGSSGLNCVSSYTYDSSREIDLSMSDQSKKPIEVGIACSGFAKAEYYSLAN